MFDAIIKDQFWRRVVRWLLGIIFVFWYVVILTNVVEIILPDDLDFIISTGISFAATVVASFFIVVFIELIAKPRCSVCQKTENELTQPSREAPYNGIYEYGGTFFCDGCLTRAYDQRIKNRLDQIEKSGVIKFYRDNKDGGIQ